MPRSEELFPGAMVKLETQAPALQNSLDTALAGTGWHLRGLMDEIWLRIFGIFQHQFGSMKVEDPF